jgi:hypothetical protein
MMFRFQVPSKLSLFSMVCRMMCKWRVYSTSDVTPIYSFMTEIVGLLSVMDFMDVVGSLTCLVVRTTFHDTVWAERGTVE